MPERDDGAPPALSHLDEEGRARMVDVSDKPATRREAEAAGRVRMQPQTLALIQRGGVAKGDVLAVAELAGVMAAKRTAELIPLCHPLPLSDVQVRARADEAAACVEIRAVARTTGPTGVEMEALAAVAVAALTVYDMCKAADRGMCIEAVRLLRKSGGRSGDVVLEPESEAAGPRTLDGLVRDALRSVDEITPEQARRALDAPDREGWHVVDVREPDEFAAGHIPGARSLPRGFLEVKADLAHPKRDPWLADRSRPLLLYCGGGNRSALAARTLQEMGFRRVASLAGGWSAWTERGYPVESGAGAA